MKAQKIGKKKVNNGVETLDLSALEDDLDLQFPLHFDMRGRTAGALVLGKGKGLERLKFVFGFECRGIHSTLKVAQQEAMFDSIESGLKDLPPGETLTLHFGSFSSDSKRQQQLSQVAKEAPSDRLKFLIYSEKQRVQELTRSGVRKPKFLKIYVTYTIDPKLAGATDPTEKAIKRLSEWWHGFTGQLEEVEQTRYETLFTKAFADGFQLWEQLLSNKMALDVRPMSVYDLWANVWARFNQTIAPALPQVIIMSDRGIREKTRSSVHPTTLLLESQEACPIADRAWTYVNGKYVAALTFMDKPAGWASKGAQLNYLWDILARDTVTDSEVFCELTRANEALVRTNMQRLTKQSITSSDLASSKRSVDVAAQIKTRRAVAAQEQLYEGSLPVYTAVTLLVHRKTPERLDEACRYLQACIRRPAWIDREREYAWLIWLQTLPIKWDSLLATPFNRRMLYLTSEAPAFMTLVRPREGDGDGLELLSEEGGVPIHIDLFNQHRHLGVFGTTRSGKSVMISGWLTQALSRQVPIVVMDFPTDGASTFKDYCTFLGESVAAYFDIGSEQNNLFELPDLRALSLEQQHERLSSYVSFLETSLLTMIFGGSGDGNAETLMLRRTIRAQVTLLLKQFFADEQIKARYDLSTRCGFGTPEWQYMPTLKDFYEFCTPENLEIPVGDEESTRSLNFIRLQLRFWLNSRVGKAISAPSSFRTDAALLVFALRNLSEDDDAAILSLSAYSAALRRALASPISIFFIDESPILFQFDRISQLVANLCANGAKAGVRVILSAQDPNSIAKSPSASMIFQNLATRLIGRIQPNAVAAFVEHLKLPEEIIARNATESFFPKAEGVYSQWLLEEKAIFTYCRYYAPYQQLAVVANNPYEQKARDAFVAAYPDDAFEALALFAEELVAALRDGRKMQLPEPKRLTPKASTVKVSPSLVKA